MAERLAWDGPEVVGPPDGGDTQAGPPPAP
jgi:hypothetical protein